LAGGAHVRWRLRLRAALRAELGGGGDLGRARAAGARERDRGPALGAELGAAHRRAAVAAAHHAVGEVLAAHRRLGVGLLARPGDLRLAADGRELRVEPRHADDADALVLVPAVVAVV